MTDRKSSILLSLAVVTGFLSVLLLMHACGGSGSGSSTGGATATGTVKTTITDPGICGPPGGPFERALVTITRVRAHTSATAGPNDTGWVDLVDLRKAPLQIDLLSLGQGSCFLTPLQSTTGIPAGQYRQVRLHLLTNSPGPTDSIPTVNNCTGGFNCVIFANGFQQPIDISSEAQNGIRIFDGQISGGVFNVASSTTLNLNIDFDVCSSLIQIPTGFRLKPVLHAADIGQANITITGRILNANTGQTISNVLVALEQRDPNNPNLSRISDQRITGLDGGFSFCPLPAGTLFDVVAVVVSPLAFKTTAILQVPSGTAMGNIFMPPEFGPAASPVTISGQVSTNNARGAITSADVSLSALQKMGDVFVTMPSLTGSSPTLASDNGNVGFTLIVPAMNPQFGNFGFPLSLPSAGTPALWANALAFIPMSSSTNPGAPDCAPSSLPQIFDPTTQLVFNSGLATQTFIFTSCQ